MSASVSFSGRCTNTQKSDILAALDAASGIANNSSSYLAVDKPNGQRYRSWFGAYDATRWGRDQLQQRSRDAIDNKPLTFDCGLQAELLCLRLSDQPQGLSVQELWTAPVTGTDSAPAPLSNELSELQRGGGHRRSGIRSRPMRAIWRARIPRRP